MDLAPDRLFRIAAGFLPAKALLAATSAGVFDHLAGGPQPFGALRAALGWQERGARDLLDGLVALGVLERDGDGDAARYRNGPEAQRFLVASSPDSMAGFLRMCDARLYRFWADLGEALRTGRPQNEIKHTGEPMFARLYREPESLRGFLAAMRGFSTPAFRALAERLDFRGVRTLLDVGGASAELSIQVAQRHPHVRCVSFDLPEVAPIAAERIAEEGLQDRVATATGDFFRDPLPPADVVTMGMILHDWNEERKLQLLRAAYAALPPGGRLVVVESLIDDARRERVLPLMMSLNMLIEFGDAFDFTEAELREWCRAVGFTAFEVLPLANTSRAGVATK